MDCTAESQMGGLEKFVSDTCIGRLLGVCIDGANAFV